MKQVFFILLLLSFGVFSQDLWCDYPGCGTGDPNCPPCCDSDLLPVGCCDPFYEFGGPSCIIDTQGCIVDGPTPIPGKHDPLPCCKSAINDTEICCGGLSIMKPCVCQYDSTGLPCCTEWNDYYSMYTPSGCCGGVAWDDYQMCHGQWAGHYYNKCDFPNTEWCCDSYPWEPLVPDICCGGNSQNVLCTEQNCGSYFMPSCCSFCDEINCCNSLLSFCGAPECKNIQSNYYYSHSGSITFTGIPTADDLYRRWYIVAPKQGVIIKVQFSMFKTKICSPTQMFDYFSLFEIERYNEDIEPTIAWEDQESERTFCGGRTSLDDYYYYKRDDNMIYDHFLGTTYQNFASQGYYKWYSMVLGFAIDTQLQSSAVNVTMNWEMIYPYPVRTPFDWCNTNDIAAGDYWSCEMPYDYFTPPLELGGFNVMWWEHQYSFELNSEPPTEQLYWYDAWQINENYWQINIYPPGGQTIGNYSLKITCTIHDFSSSDYFNFTISPPLLPDDTSWLEADTDIVTAPGHNMPCCGNTNLGLPQCWILGQEIGFPQDCGPHPRMLPCCEFFNSTDCCWGARTEIMCPMYRTMPNMLAFTIYARKFSLPVQISQSSFIWEVVEGNGMIVDFGMGWPYTSFDYMGNSFWNNQVRESEWSALYTTNPYGGTAIIRVNNTEGVILGEKMIEMFSCPDGSSYIQCDKFYGLAGQQLECRLYPRFNNGPIRIHRDQFNTTGSVFTIISTDDPNWNISSPFSELTPIITTSWFDFTVDLGDVNGVYTFALSSFPDFNQQNLYSTTDIDTTSQIICLHNEYTAGKSDLICALICLSAGIPVTSTSDKFDVLFEPEDVLSITTYLSDASEQIIFQIAAIEDYEGNVTIRYNLTEGGEISSNHFNITIRLPPDETSSFWCPMLTTMYETFTCELIVRRSDIEYNALLAGFSLQILSGETSFDHGQFRTNWDKYYPPLCPCGDWDEPPCLPGIDCNVIVGELPLYFWTLSGTHFYFDLYPPSQSQKIKITDGFNTQEIVVYDYPDANAILQCDKDYVRYGNIINCEFRPMKDKNGTIEQIYAHMGSIIINTNGGKVYPLYTDEVVPAADRFYFDYEANLNFINIITLTATFGFYMNETSTYELKITQIPDETSTLYCRSNEIVANVPHPCYFIPRKNNEIINAERSFFSVIQELDGQGYISEIDIEAGSLLTFTFEPFRSHTNCVIQGKLIIDNNEIDLDSISFNVIAPGRLLTFYPYIFPSEKDLFQADEDSSVLGRPYDIFTSGEPQDISTSALSGNERFVDMICAQASCFAVEADGGLISWGEGNPWNLGRYTSNIGTEFFDPGQYPQLPHKFGFDDGEIVKYIVKQVSTRTLYDWDDSYQAYSIALTSDGRIWQWNTSTIDFSKQGPELWDQKKYYPIVHPTIQNIKLISQGGEFFLYADSNGVVYSSCSHEATYLGRDGGYTYESILPITESGSEVTHLVASQEIQGRAYGIIVRENRYIYSWGLGLSSTILDSFEYVSSTPYDFYDMHGSYIKLVVDTNYQNFLVVPVVIVDTDGQLWMVSEDILLQPLDLGIEKITLVAASRWQVLLSDGNKVVLAKNEVSYENGIPTNIIRNMDTQIALPTGASINILFASRASLISLEPPIVEINPDLTDEEEKCGSNIGFRCRTVSQAFENFPWRGTIFSIHTLNNPLIENNIPQTGMNDILFTSLTNNPDNSVFDCRLKRCFELSGTGVQFRDVTLKQGQAFNSKGGCLHVPNDMTWLLSNTRLIDCSADLGGGAILNQGFLTIEDSVISFGYTGNPTKMGNGGGIYADAGSYTKLNNVTITNCSSVGHGAGIYLIDADTFIIENSEIIGNYANDFGDEKSFGGGIDATNIDLFTATNVIIQDNHVPQGSGGGISIRDSYLKMINVNFIDNSGFLHGGALYVEFSYVSLFGCLFQRNEVSSVDSGSGGGIYILGNRDFIINNGEFIQNKAGYYGGAIHTLYCEPTISSTLFNSNEALYGGALSIGSQASISIYQSQFTSNYATYGGAIAVSDCIKTILDNCTINLCTADSGQGGGIHSRGLSHVELKNVLLYSNSAVNGSGGAIWWEKNEPAWDFDTMFISNTAKHGNAISIASEIKDLIWYDYYIPPEVEIGSGEIVNVSLQVTVVDYYGSIVTVENSAVAEITYDITDPNTNFVGNKVCVFKDGICWLENWGLLKTPNSFSSFAINSFFTYLGKLQTTSQTLYLRDCKPGEYVSSTICTKCLPGTFSTEYGSLTCESCEPGWKNNIYGSIGCNPCSTGTYASGVGSTECMLCSPHRYSNQLNMSECLVCQSGTEALGNGNTECNLCQAGSASSQGYECIECEEGYYSFIEGSTTCQLCPSNSITKEGTGHTECLCKIHFYGLNDTDDQLKCLSCPEGADCTHLGTMIDNLIPLPNYYPMEYEPGEEPRFMRCINDACQAQSVEELCHEGYQGPLCTVCSSDYYRYGASRCRKCPDSNENTIRLVGLTIGVIFFIVLVIGSTLRDQRRKPHSIVIRIGLSALQFNSFAANFEYHIPYLIERLYEMQQTAAEVGSSILSIDCYISENYHLRPYFLKSILYLCLPFIICTIATMIFLPLYLIRKYHYGIGNSAQHTISQFINSLVIALFLVYPSITRACFSMFSCKSVGGDKYLLADMSQQCYTPFHNNFILYVSLPMLIFYVIGLPLFAFYILFKYRKNLKDFVFRKRFLFLYGGYESRFFYWELIVLARKVLLVVITVFFIDKSVLMGLFTLFLCVLALIAHVFCLPFSTKEMNTIEAFSLVTSFTIFFCGQMLYMDDILDPFSRYLIYIIIFGILVSFYISLLLVIIYYFRQNAMTKLRGHRKEKKVKNADFDDEDIIWTQSPMYKEALKVSMGNKQDGVESPHMAISQAYKAKLEKEEK